MTERPRKTLGLPDKVVTANPKRPPVRGGAPAAKRGPATDPRPAEATPSGPKKDWRRARPRPASDGAAPRESAPASAGAAPRPARAPAVREAQEKPLVGEVRGAREKPAIREAREKPAVRGAREKPVVRETHEAQEGVRLSKLMAGRGLCSRREADEFIERGWVTVDGVRITELGTRVDPSVEIALLPSARASQRQLVTIVLHKPVGYVSGQPEPGLTPAVTLIQPENQELTPDSLRFHPRHLKGLAPAGRLDIDSTGLLVLTQDGRVARQLIGENSQIEKEYLVRVEGELDENGLTLLRHGLSLDGKKLKPARVEWLNADQLRFVLNEGRKRQIRRMCELVGLRVVGLKRVRMGKVMLGDLPAGKWRFLREGETF